MTNNSINAAYFLANRLAVFECRNNRAPKVKAWQDIEYWNVDEDTALAWRCYGVAIDPEWLVVDVDLRKPEAHTSFAKLSEVIDFSKLFMCKTARGGYHYWFKNPTCQPIRKNPPEYPGIDFLSDGCYVIGPGSIAETGTYEYDSGDLLTTAEAPPALLGLVEKIAAVYQPDIDITSVNQSIEEQRYRQWLMEQPRAIAGMNGNDHTYNMAAYAFDFGLHKEYIFPALLEWNEGNSPPWSIDELKAIVENAGRYCQNKKGKAAIQFEAFTSGIPDNDTEEEVLDGAGYQTKVYDEAFYEKLHPGCDFVYSGNVIKATATNIRIALMMEMYRGMFQWDVFREKVCLDRVPPWRGNKSDISLEMKPTDWVQLKLHLAMELKVEAPMFLIEEGVKALALAKEFHPICDWLNGLKWDGKPRLHLLFGHDSYKLTIAKIFLLASVYRIFYPGYKFHHMLVLAGPQGVGKSSLIEELGGSFTKVLQSMPTDRKGLQEMQGAWWIELPEMSAVKKIDINAVKAFITNRIDTFIPMFGHHGAQDYPRIAIPVWSLNPDEVGYIKDDVNRRFLIVEQKDKIDFKTVAQERDNIFAEVMELYRQGIRPHHLVKTIAVKAEKIAQANKQDDTDPWEGAIKKWIDLAPRERITGSDIFVGALDMYRPESWDLRGYKRVAKCLRRLGWISKRAGGGNYYVKEGYEDIDNDEEQWDIDV